MAAKQKQEERKQAILEGRQGGGDEGESMASSTLYSEKSGSKKSGLQAGKTPDAKSVQSPHTQSERPDDKSKTHSER